MVITGVLKCRVGYEKKQGFVVTMRVVVTGVFKCRAGYEQKQGFVETIG